MSYKHMNLVQRIRIRALLDAGHSQSFIARMIGCDRSTVCNELKRNSVDGRYDPFLADENATGRRKMRKKESKLENDPELRRLIMEGLKRGDSPEKISEDLERLSSSRPDSPSAHFTTIYKWIHKGCFDHLDDAGRPVSGVSLLKGRK